MATAARKTRVSTTSTKKEWAKQAFELPTEVKEAIDLEVKKAFELVCSGQSHPNMLTPRWITRNLIGKHPIMGLSTYAAEQIQKQRSALRIFDEHPIARLSCATI